MKHIILFAIFLLLRSPPFFKITQQTSYLLYRIGADVLIILAILLIAPIGSTRQQTLLGWNRIKIQDLLYGILLGAMLLLIALPFFGSLSSNTVNQMILFHTRLFFIPYLTIVIIAITEELFYRSFVIQLLKSFNMSIVLIVIISALLFGLGHISLGIEGVLFSMIAGVIFAVVLLRSNSLWICMLGHVTYNLLVYLMQSTSNS